MRLRDLLVIFLVSANQVYAFRTLAWRPFSCWQARRRRLPSSSSSSSSSSFSSSSLRTRVSFLSSRNGGDERDSTVYEPSTYEASLVHDTTTTVSTASVRKASTLPARHVRWHSTRDDTWQFQTAVTTWKHPKTSQTVELHALVHFADKEYFQSLGPEFSQSRLVLYELLLDDSMLEPADREGKYRRVRTPLSASFSDKQVGKRYQWACQSDVLDYQQPQWRHADFTREELEQALRRQQQQQQSSWGATNNKNNKHNSDFRPLWQQMTASPSGATEAATALLVGPPTMADKDSGRRLFSNLFLPGSNLATVLRLTLWLTVPAPELSILLLDWSCTMSGSGGSSSSTRSRNLWQASWSPVLRFLLQAVWAGRLDIVQRLAFGQVLLTGSRPTLPSLSSSNKEKNNMGESLLIQGRNQQALRVLDETLKDSMENKHDDNDVTIALLYGSSHCPGLCQSLRRRGFVLQSTAWRTAWQVQLDAAMKPSINPVTAAAPPLWLIPALLYLIASGTDWLASWQAVRHAESATDVGILAGAYGIRHVLLYLGLSKVVLDWQRPGGE